MLFLLVAPRFNSISCIGTASGISPGFLLAGVRLSGASSGRSNIFDLGVFLGESETAKGEVQMSTKKKKKKGEIKSVIKKDFHGKICTIGIG